MKQLEREIQAELKGGSVMAVNQPVQLLVAVKGRSEPFWAHTVKPMKQICGASGIRLEDSTMIPWRNLQIGRQVLIREVNVEGETVPLLVLKSLTQKRFF